MNEQQFDLLLEKIYNKLVSNDNSIQQLRTELSECQNKLQNIDAQLAKHVSQNIDAQLAKHVSQNIDAQLAKHVSQNIDAQLAKHVSQNIDEKKENQTSCEQPPSDFTKLTAYRQAAMFAEVKRPTNINELYMMVIQSQHLLYEMRLQIDNISRRN
jgi:hypothetical protein